MAKIQVQIWEYECERCGHEWLPREKKEKEPRVCPKCKSPYWNVPRKTHKSNEKEKNIEKG